MKGQWKQIIEAIWKDPVWSKVISVAIIALFGGVVELVRFEFQFALNLPVLLISSSLVVILLLLTFFYIRIQKAIQDRYNKSIIADNPAKSVSQADQSELKNKLKLKYQASNMFGHFFRDKNSIPAIVIKVHEHQPDFQNLFSNLKSENLAEYKNGAWSLTELGQSVRDAITKKSAI